jgi:hypothetical protein
MYVVIRNNEITASYSENERTYESLTRDYPDCEIQQIDFYFTPNTAKALLRVYEGTVVTKPTVLITSDRQRFLPDQIDEIEIKIQILELQPNEAVNELELSVADAKITIPIIDNKGILSFATDKEAVLLIKTSDTKRFACMSLGVVATYERVR